MRIYFLLPALLALASSAAGAIDELSLISAELSAASGPNRADCPPGVDLKELLSDLEETPNWADLWPGTAAAGMRGITGAALYQSCRAEALRDEAPCDALDGAPSDMLNVFKFNRAPRLLAAQAGNHCRLNLALQAHLSGSKDYRRFCLRSWQVEKNDLDVVCGAVSRHFPSPSDVCAEILAKAPALASAPVCRSSMAAFFGEAGACEVLSSPFGDRETCYWVREVRQIGFNAETCRTRGCGALSGRKTACRAYVAPTVARLCSPPRTAAGLLKEVAALRARLADEPSDEAARSRAIARADALWEALRAMAVYK